MTIDKKPMKLLSRKIYYDVSRIVFVKFYLIRYV